MKPILRALSLLTAAAALLIASSAQAQSERAEAFIGTYLPEGVHSYESVAEQIPRFQEAVLPCYTAALDLSPGLTGMLVMRLRVATSGSIVGVEVLDNRTGSDPLAVCAQERIQALQMPANLGMNVRITLPVSFVTRLAALRTFGLRAA